MSEWSDYIQIRKDWEEFGNRFGWKLIGWSSTWEALFEVDDIETIIITKTVRMQIEEAIKNESVSPTDLCS